MDITDLIEMFGFDRVVEALEVANSKNKNVKPFIEKDEISDFDDDYLEEDDDYLEDDDD